MSDRIILHRLELFARHGVREEERRLGQRFVLNVTAHLDLRAAGESDEYERAVCYDALAQLVAATFTARAYNLIEAAAEAVAQAILTRFPAIERVEVELRKPAAPIEAVFAYVAVAIERGRHG